MTLPATVIVTTGPSPLRPALLLVGLAESQSTLAPSRNRPTHTLLQIALQILSRLPTLTRAVGICWHGHRLAHCHATRLPRSPAARDGPGRCAGVDRWNLTASPRAPWGARWRGVAHLANRSRAGPPFRQPKREGQGDGELRCRHFQPTWDSQQSRLRDMAPPQDPGGREGVSTSDNAEDELFVRESMTTTSLDFGQSCARVHYTSCAGGSQPVFKYWRQLHRHGVPGCLLCFDWMCAQSLLDAESSRLFSVHKLSQEFSRRRWF